MVAPAAAAVADEEPVLLLAQLLPEQADVQVSRLLLLGLSAAVAAAAWALQLHQ